MALRIAVLVLLAILGTYSSLPYEKASFPQLIRYESEDAHVIGSARTSQNEDEDSPRGFVVFTEKPSEDFDGAIIFTVNIPSDNMYPLSIAYSTGVDSSISIKINGIEQMMSFLPMSPRWSTKVESVFLRTGLNSIVIKSVKVAGPLSVDYIEIDGAISLALRGATLNYFEIEAENATHNGHLIGPSRDLYQLPTEASGRLAVQINQGQYVEFTLTAAANAIVVRFSIPDTPSGSGQTANLNVMVDGSNALNLTVTSIYSWAYGDYPFTKNPSNGKAHHFYDEVRGLFGKTLPAGTKVRVAAVNPITYTIDLADFYMVPGPYPKTAGYISITDHGADPSGQKDSTAAFTAAIAAAGNGGVWIPEGYFLVTTRFTLNKITVRGAGPWYSTVRATVNHGVGFFGSFAPNPSSDVQLFDFAVVGDTNVRDDNAADSGVGGSFNGNSLVQNLWIEHTKCGMWLDGPFNGLHVMGTTIRNTYADGINLHQGISNVVVEQTILRNVADDALAMWSEKNADTKNVFKFNTIQIPLLANGIALYGGQDNSATDNYVADSIGDGGGLQIGNRYNSVGIAGTTLLARNTLVRCGGPSRFGPQDCGSIWLWQEQGAFTGSVQVTNIESTDSSFAAVTFWGGSFDNTVISGLTVNGGPYVMEVNSASGNVPCDHVVANGLTLPYGGIHSCAGLIFVDKGGNTGWDMSHDHQHCN